MDYSVLKKYYIPFDNFGVKFKYKGSVVWSEQNIVNVMFFYENDSWWSITDVECFIRKDELTILDIIAFITGYPISVYDCFECNAEKSILQEYGQKQMQVESSYCIFEDKDLTSDLEKLLDMIQNDSKFISLIDQWRKGKFLEKESNDADCHLDEAFLCYFHILEWFGSEISSEINTIFEDRIKTFLSDYFSLLSCPSNILEQKRSEYSKTIKKLLEPEIGIAQKIKYWLKKYGILDEFISSFVDNAVKMRNNVAHMNIPDYNSFSWPLSPFFSIIPHAYEKINTISLLSAVMISSYANVDLWTEEWNKELKCLPPPKSLIERFLNHKLETEEIDFHTFNRFHISWDSLFEYYIHHPSQEMLLKLSSSVKNYYLNAFIENDSGRSLFNISVILADAMDEDIRKKAQENVKRIIGERKHGWSNYRDVYFYLHSLNVEVVWYLEFIKTIT